MKEKLIFAINNCSAMDGDVANTDPNFVLPNRNLNNSNGFQDFFQ